VSEKTRSAELERKPTAQLAISGKGVNDTLAKRRCCRAFQCVIRTTADWLIGSGAGDCSCGAPGTHAGLTFGRPYSNFLGLPRFANVMPLASAEILKTLARFRASNFAGPGGSASASAKASSASLSRSAPGTFVSTREL
jgi:hypothetical protein